MRPCNSSLRSAGVSGGVGASEFGGSERRAAGAGSPGLPPLTSMMRIGIITTPEDAGLDVALELGVAVSDESGFDVAGFDSVGLVAPPDTFKASTGVFSVSSDALPSGPFAGFGGGTERTLNVPGRSEPGFTMLAGAFSGRGTAIGSFGVAGTSAASGALLASSLIRRSSSFHRAGLGPSCLPACHR